MEQPVSEVPKVSPEQIKHDFQNKAYEIEGTKVNVLWKEFSPTNNDESILFLTGWSAGTAKTLEYLSRRFAGDSGRTALAIATRTEKVIPDSLYKEAQAVRNLIVEKGFKKIILAAHSEGGTKATNLIDILQKENQNIDIQGLILLDPVGLYEQGRGELISKFILDTSIHTPITITKNLLKNPSLALKGLQASSDIIFNIAREMAKTKVAGYPTKLWSQITEMAKANTHYQDVKCPVVLIQGADDPVSSPDRIISKKERARYAQEAKERADQARWYRVISAKDSADRFPHDPAWIDQRNEAVQEAFFPNSPEVHWLVPKKIGHHGLPHFRADSVSRVSIGLLEKYWRTQTTPAQTSAPISQV